MGGNMSRIAGCFTPGAHQEHHHYPYHHQDKLGTFVCEPSDEGLGHSFCYVRPIVEATPHLSPSPSGRYSVPPDIELSNSFFRQTNLDNVDDRHRQKNVAETSFKNISGASVSANTSTPRTITSREQFSAFANISYDRAAAFESTASFTSLPLQLVPRGLSQSGSMSGPLSGQTSGPLERGFLSGPIERGFMSGPLERGFLSGPLERGCVSGPIEATDRSLFSAPLSGPYATYLRRRRRSLAQLVRTFGNPVKKVLSRSLSKTTSTLLRTQKSLAVPTKFTLGHSKDTAREGGSHCECSLDFGYESWGSESRESHNLQWAQGKAGEDRMHVVLSEEHGWLFVGIYDGFNGPDAPDFLMSNLYREVYKELRGLLWNKKEMGIGKVEERVDVQGKGAMDCLDAVHHQEEADVCRLNNKKDLFTACQQSCSKSSTSPQCESSKRQQGVEDYFMDDEEIKSIHFDRCSYSMEADRSSMIGSSSVDPDSSKLLSGNYYKEPLSDDKMVYRHEWDACEPAVCGSLATPEPRKHSFTFSTGDHDGNNKVVDTYNSVHQQGQNSLVKKQRKLWFRRLLLEKRDIKERQKKCSDSDQDRKGLYKRLDDKHKQDDGKLYRNGNADHVAVLAALSRALASTENAYLQMADHSMEEMPELALMGSCVLVMLMKGEDVYVMNVGDSRAVLAQVKSEPEGSGSSPKAHAVGQVTDSERIGARDSQLRQELERIMEEPSKELMICTSSHTGSSAEPPSESLFLNALQLSSDHSTNIEQEILRIKSEHPDDKKTISNERVKGRLKVTRAFGAGFLKAPRWNNALLEMFRIDYVGTAPYVTCIPALHHHVLGPNDRFLVLSSDGLYQYLSNEEVVAHVEWFMEKYPDGDPAQYLIEELLFRAAKKAGMDFHDLLDIPHGDRRKYHDDVSVMIISLEGRIWRSFG